MLHLHNKSEMGHVIHSTDIEKLLYKVDSSKVTQRASGMTQDHALAVDNPHHNFAIMCEREQ